MRHLLCLCFLSGLGALSCGGDEFSAKGTGGTSGGGSGGATGGGAGSGGSDFGGAGGAAGTGASAGSGGGGGNAGSGGAAGGTGGSGTGGATGGTGGTGGATGGSGGTGGSANCVTQTSVKPSPAGSEQVLAVTDDVQPEYPVVDSTHLYWTTNTTLWRIDKAGTCLEQVATAGTQLEGVALDGGYAYVADLGGTNVVRVPITGGTFQVLVSGQNPQTVAVDATHVYWCALGAGVGRRLKDGTGSWEVVATAASASQCYAIAVDDTYVFAATRTGALVRALKQSNSAVTTLDSVTGTLNTDSVYIALYESRVYWTHWLNNPDSGGIRSVTKTGTNLITFTETHPEGFATDGTSAYWAVPYSPGGRIRKGPAALTSGNDLVTNQLRPRGVAIDGTHVYWTNFNDRTVRRALR